MVQQVPETSPPSAEEPSAASAAQEKTRAAAVQAQTFEAQARENAGSARLARRGLRGEDGRVLKRGDGFGGDRKDERECVGRLLA